jgi:ParB family chromosome partitioning protein
VLDTRVTIQGSAKKGTIVIEFAGSQDLQRITKLIERSH